LGDLLPTFNISFFPFAQLSVKIRHKLKRLRN
jgi:hypothetical protein